MAVSGRNRGWVWDQTNSRLSVYVDGTEVARFDDATNDLALLTNGLTAAGGLTATSGGLTVTGGASRLNNDLLLSWGTNSDITSVNRSTALAANTALTSVLSGTPVAAATPANSLLVSNKTANGDIAFFGLLGGTNSTELLRFDVSAGLTVFNEASADIDLRAESDGNANAFVLDAGIHGGVGSVNLGAAASDGIFFQVSRPATTATAATNWHSAYITTAGAVTIPTGTTTLVNTFTLDEPNITATGTVTNSATLAVLSVATEATNNLGVAIPQGSVTAVGLGFYDGTNYDADTGFYQSAANFLNITTGGTQRANFSVAGQRIGNSSATHATTVGVNILSMFTGTAPAGTLASGGSFYAATATNVEINWIDSGGNAQQLSTT